MAPGQRLVEEELAGMLAVTRASLRAALFDLTAEGLVERVPNRGARVRVVTAEEAVAITECRMALEALCAVKAAQCITDDEAAQLRELGENLKRAVADGNPLRYSELNRELHRRIGVISEQHVAIGLLDRLHFLHFALAAILGFVGGKMLFAKWINVPVAVSLAFILLVVLAATAASLISPRTSQI